MSSFGISQEAIQAFSLLDRSNVPDTHLPTSLPLAFSSPLQHINVLSTLHLLTHVLSDPAHIPYFATTGTTPVDSATRGILSLYLSSSESWDKDNYLSAKAWREGVLDESTLCTFFGFEVMQEEEHESMKGVKVGKRWDQGTKLVGHVVDVLRDAGQRIRGNCLGAVVGDALEQSRKETSSVEDFSACFMDRAIEFLPCLKDPYPSPLGIHTWPAALVRLLQDLSTLRPTTSTLGVDLPDPEELANLSPLPLPISTLLHHDLLPLDDIDDNVAKAIRESLAQTRASASYSPSAPIPIPMSLYLDLMTRSVQVCQEIHNQSASSNAAAAANGQLSTKQVALVCQSIEDGEQHLMVVPHF
ncbi:hypothetical protein BD324DRAFT_620603 [Kockovaella imperatae]|uniref:Uncharacterized protein n=1 Tax=Kockovaella imperatae TaxID=4999 RepID=A0A1Y1UJY9_9TREE|nr:hypothetical protein BD324DRAFT_620603 [Kockovaella imperatae]ORX38371.1 hypothetical protein BD324DRAFT_620603 [Kockovaella imperatae]